MEPDPYIKSLITKFQNAADANKALGAKAYMRNQFEFFGIPSPLRRSIAKTHIKQSVPQYKELNEIVKQLFSLPERELHYFGMELLSLYKKQWDEKIIELIEYMIVTHSWWDTVDYVSSALAGLYFQKYPRSIKSITGRWNRSDNIWLQRSSLLFQLKYKKDIDTNLLSNYIQRHSSSKEFFIQKAIGWVLREYAKTNAAWVKDFVNKNKLAPLSRREALKRL